MKLACASGAFDRAIERGDLTQLEFVDLCAHELACDGVVLDVRHFPRTDDDYLAQLKKMAADFGVCIAALTDDGFFSSNEETMRAALAQAAALGAPLLTGRLSAETASSWSEQLARLNAATSLAKATNVTLALRNAPSTFAATSHDCKRVSKEADSAWLRFGLDIGVLDTASDPQALEAKTVLLWTSIRENGALDERIIATFEAFRGHLTLDDQSGAATTEEMRNAMHRWRIALASRELNRT
jgi:sugar phosphate isomerase/epimerase